MKILIFIALFIYTSFALADMSHFNFSSSYTGTRDHFMLRSFGMSWDKNRRYSGWEYPNEDTRAYDYGLSTTINNGSALSSKFQASRIMVNFGRKWSKSLSTKIFSGVHELKNKSSNQKHVTVPVKLEQTFKVKEWLFSSISLVKDWNYQDLQLSSAVDNFTKKSTVHHHFLITPTERVRLSLRGRNSKYSDTNKSYTQDLDMKYKVGPKHSWYLVGLGSEYTRFEKNLSGYWTPRKFLSVGPRFEVVQSIKEKFSLSLALNLNRFRDENGAWGDGFYSNTAITYGKRESLNTSLGYERIQSRQSENLWYSEKIYLNLNHFY
ncbi:MAG: hypothetical protein KC493_00710 [Bacteriovoracaceae bacterium]|nr:hypothetical protein [Bacteriovoracaceae bacterium]